MRIFYTAALAAAIALSGCTRPTGTAAETQQGAAQTSAAWEQSVKDKLAADPAVGATNIAVSANPDRNEVTLSGTVYSEPMRAAAVDAAKAARPGAQVIDKIEVKPAEIPRNLYTDDMARQTRQDAKAKGDRLGNSLDDAWIHTKISAKLIADSNTPARKMNIDVVNGVVTLRGFVDSPEAKAEASRLAMDTDGVKKVNNLLRVRAG
ncbi:MAG TPA: BON domain-containing protein [Bryobacteraceae bacterium]|nr:BON domain-containing protein [Bryobacteraceae bacterium]